MLKKLTGYFGGSFDPPHLGHLAVARAVLASGRADEVWLAPAWLPPHKSRTRAPFADRLAMTRLACADVPGVRACGCEGDFQLSPSYTVDVLARLQARHPDREFALVIGGDMLASFYLWYRAEFIATHYKIITYPRCGEAVSTAALRRNWPPELADELAASVLASAPCVNCSSTEMRLALSSGKAVDGQVAPEVLKYITEHKLYTKEV